MAEPYKLTPEQMANLGNMGAVDFSGVDMSNGLFGNASGWGSNFTPALPATTGDGSKAEYDQLMEGWKPLGGAFDGYDQSKSILDFGGIGPNGTSGNFNFPDYGDANTYQKYGNMDMDFGMDFGFDMGDLYNGASPVVPNQPAPPPPLGQPAPPPTYTPTPAPPPTVENPINNPDIGYDPISGAPVGTGPSPEQGGDLPPNYVPPPNSRDWLGHVLTPTNSLLPQQLERSGPIRRVTPVSQLFNNPINNNRSNVPTTALGDALRGGTSDG